MPTRNVVLTRHHEELIADLVASGRYQNASEVLRDGLRLVEERAREEETKLQALRAASAIGLADLDEGRYREVPADHVADYVSELGRRVAARSSTSDRT